MIPPLLAKFTRVLVRQRVFVAVPASTILPRQTRQVDASPDGQVIDVQVTMIDCHVPKSSRKPRGSWRKERQAGITWDGVAERPVLVSPAVVGSSRSAGWRGGSSERPSSITATPAVGGNEHEQPSPPVSATNVAHCG